MASTDVPKEDMQALSQQSEAVQRAAADLSAATARARSWRLCLVVAAVLLVAFICYKFYSLGMAIQDEKYGNELLKIGQERLLAKRDQYRGHVERLWDTTSPVISKAFTEQAKKDMPEFMKKMEQEKDTLAANLEADFTKKINAHYEQMSAQQENILKQEFPAIKDPATHERMVKNIDKAVQNLVKRYHVEELRRQTEELISTWDHFPEAERPKPGEPTLEEQLITDLLQLLALRLSSGGFVPR